MEGRKGGGLRERGKEDERGVGNGKGMATAKYGPTGQAMQ